jgi:Flp pilus assembly protein TadD
METSIQQAITAHEKGELQEAERLYQVVLKTQPTNLDVNNNLGLLLYSLDRFDEAAQSYKKVIELKPDYVEAHNNLGNILLKLKKLDEAEASFKKAIELKPDYVEAHSNLGILLNTLARPKEAEKSFKKVIELKPDYADAYGNLGITLNLLSRSNEAEKSFKKVIELRPDYAEAYYNLGNTLNQLGRPDEAAQSYKKAIELKPDYVEAHTNLNIISSKNELLKILKTRKLEGKSKLNNLVSSVRLASNPFISNRDVEPELLTNLYKIKATEINLTTSGPLFGMGRTTDYQLFKSNCSILKTVENDLINIMKQAVKSDIYIIDSFYNILDAGGGSDPHTHLSIFDKVKGLINQKFSLVYYVSVGDQNCNEPGIFKMYDPEEEILPAKGMVIIIPAGRKHSAVYGGKKDRVMIGVNFYSLN